MNSSGFPDVTSPFAETPITQVGPPNPALLQSPVVADAADSVLKIRGRAPSCSRQLEGTGFVIGPQLVMTNAHVVAGTAETGVEVIGRRGRTVELDAKVVLYDPQTDLAMLRVPDLEADPLTFEQTPANAGDDVLVLGYPLDGPFTATAGKIRQMINLKGPNIYDTGEITRQVYTVRAVVRSGNSGGPMIDPAGPGGRGGVRGGAGRPGDRLRAHRRAGLHRPALGLPAHPRGRHRQLRRLTRSRAGITGTGAFSSRS